MRDEVYPGSEGDHPAAPAAPNDQTRRHFLLATSSVAVGATTAIGMAGSATAASKPSSVRAVDVENLGPGNTDYPLLGTTLLGGVMYLGSRNLSPTRVAGFAFGSSSVEQSFTLGNGNYVRSMANDGDEVVYGGVNQAQPDTNLYGCNVRTGEVTELARVPDQSVAALAVAPDGVVYTSGRPENGNRPGPALFSYDPETTNLTNLGVPSPEAGQSIALAVTAETVYFGCGSSSAVSGPAGLFALDRASGESTDILPSELSGLRQINAIEVFDDILVVGGGTVGVYDLSAEQWRFTDAVGGRQNVFARQGEIVYAAASNGLFRIDLDAWDVVRLGDPGEGLGDYQALTILDGLLVGSMSGGYVWSYDPDSETSQLYGLLEAGAPGGPQSAQSVGVVDQVVYVGGNNSVDTHDIAAGNVTKLALPGEVKAMARHDGVMYMAAYAPAALWSHIPGEATATRLAEFPANQNRPRSVEWDDVNGLVAVGIRSDSTGGGSLCLYDPQTGDLVCYIDPLGDSQWVDGVAPGHGLIYIAGSNPGGESGDIAAWDPVAGEEVWRLETPLGADGGIRQIAVHDRKLFGLSTVGPRFFVVDVDPTTGPSLIHEDDYSEYASEAIPSPHILVDRDLVYGMTYRSLFRVDPVDYQTDLVLDDLDADFFSGPDVAAGDEHHLYTLAGRDLIQVRDDPPARAQ